MDLVTMKKKKVRSYIKDALLPCSFALPKERVRRYIWKLSQACFLSRGYFSTNSTKIEIRLLFQKEFHPALPDLSF